MKTILSFLLLAVATALAEVPPFTTVKLAFDYPAPGTVTFYIRETNGPTVTVIGVTTNTTFDWTNVTPSTRRLSVTASNIWGESAPSVPLILPSAPSVPSNLRPVTTSFRIQAPSTFETTTDLLTWDERFRVFKPDSNGVQIVRMTVTPSQPFRFVRGVPMPMPGQPPVPKL